MKIKSKKIVTLKSSGRDDISVWTCLRIDGIALIDFRGRKARRVLRARKFKLVDTNVNTPKRTMRKSSTFQPSRR